MIKRIFYTALSVLFAFNFCAAQPTVDYVMLKENAYALYVKKSFKASAITYGKAFRIDPRNIQMWDLYNASCAWALAGEPDSSFLYLEKLAGEKYEFGNLSHLLSDADLKSLHTNPRWDTLVKKVDENRSSAEEKLNKGLISKLDSIYEVDQGYRSQIDSVLSTYGDDSPQKKDLFEAMISSDSTNVIEVKQIVRKYGWPGTDIAGKRGNKTIWLVIQHADLATQLKFLPLLRASVEQGKSKPYYLALMEDRIAMRQGKKQIYGSQYQRDPETGNYSIYPIADEIHVNERRKSVGLPPLEVDARNYGVDYKLPSKN